jgi:hypothetical protein
MRLESGIARALWLVTVSGMVVFLVTTGLDAYFGYDARWLEAIGLIAWTAALPALVALLVLAGRDRFRRRTSA